MACLRRKRWFQVLGAAVMVAFMLWPETVPADVASPDSRKAAPDFTLQDSNGRSFKLSDYKGSVVLLDFWATWCGGCKVEIPWYVEFQSKYKSDGLSVIGVSMDESWTPVKPFLQEHKLNYPVAIGNDAIANLYSVRSMPVTLLIDKSGRIADSHTGIVDKEAFEKEIQTLLQEKQ
jgi:peroxiredoxin